MTVVMACDTNRKKLKLSSIMGFNDMNDNIQVGHILIQKVSNQFPQRCCMMNMARRLSMAPRTVCALFHTLHQWAYTTTNLLTHCLNASCRKSVMHLSRLSHLLLNARRIKGDFQAFTMRACSNTVFTHQSMNIRNGCASLLGNITYAHRRIVKSLYLCLCGYWCSSFAICHSIILPLWNDVFNGKYTVIPYQVGGTAHSTPEGRTHSS
jgi:hypothetical protein